MFVGKVWLLLLSIVGTANCNCRTQKHCVALLVSIVASSGTNSIVELVSRVVIDSVNNRSDILPDYDIELVYMDEGTNSYNVVSNAIQYSRQFEQESLDKSMINNTVGRLYQSPVMVAGGYTAGCYAFAPIIHHLMSVSIATGCLAPDFTANRQKYPNMYRTHMPGDTVIYARLAFMIKFGHWKRFALLTAAQNAAVFLTKKMYEQSLKEGLSVVRYDILSDPEDENSMRALKESDARIIVFESSDVVGAHAFLCGAYNVGLTGSKYVFILPSNMFVEPIRLPELLSPSCPRNTVIVQLEYTLFIGMLSSSIEDEPEITTLGHSHQDFDRLLNQYMKASQVKPALDYYIYRDSYYDDILQALLTLDGTERLLQKRNLTLRDYARVPRDVMEAANKSAAAVDFVGMRIGRTRYSERLEIDEEPQFVFQWTPTEGQRLCIQIRLKNSAAPTFVSSYEQKELKQIIWSTVHKKAPLDIPQYVKRESNVPKEGFYVIVAITGILVIAKLVYYFWKVQRASFDNNSSLPPLVKSLLLCGCIITDSAAICFVSSLSTATKYQCILRFVLATVGLSLIHGYVCCGLGMYYNIKSAADYLRIRFSHARAEFNKRSQLVFGILVCAFTLVNTAVLVVWFRVDPITVAPISVKSEISANSNGDVNIDIFINVCESTFFYGDLWLFILGSIHLVMFTIGLFFVYNLRHKASFERILQRTSRNTVIRTVRSKPHLSGHVMSVTGSVRSSITVTVRTSTAIMSNIAYEEIKLFRLAIVNSVMLFIATITLTVFVVTAPITELFVVSVALLVTSSTCYVLVMRPVTTLSEEPYN